MAGETEAAVEALAAVIREFSVENTVTRLGQLAESARAAQQGLAEDLDALDTAASALLKLIEEQGGRIDEEMEDAVEAMNTALDGAEAKAEGMKTAADETAGALEALDSAATTLTTYLSGELTTRADEPAEKLAGQVKEDSARFDDCLVSMYECLRDIAEHEMGGARKAVIETYGKRAQGATEGCGLRLARLFEEWVGRLAGAAYAIDKKTLVAAAAHPAPAGAAMMEQSAEQHGEVFEALLPTLASLDELLGELEGDFSRVDTLLTERVSELTPDMDTLETGLATAVRELETLGTFLRDSLRQRQ